MLKKYQLCEGKVVEASTGNSPIWVYINPSEPDKKFLIDTLRVDEHTLNSALDPDELSRLEFEPEHVAMIFKRPRNYSAEEQFLFRVGSLGLFLFKERLVIVVAEETPPLFEGRQFSRIGSLPELTLKLIYRSIFHYLEHLKVINTITDELEDKIHTALENKYLLTLFSLEKSLVYYLNALHSNHMLIEKLKNNAQKIGFTQENVESLDDILIENNQCTKQAEIYSNILASLMDARASIVSNNLNVLMKTLNLITIGIMVPTLVVSIFSMNVRLPMEQWKYPWAFFIILGLAFVSVFVFVLIWKRRKFH